MAERRMISKSISVSERVNSMSLFARLLFTWMIPHTDDFGRMTGSPMKVKALVVPMADETKDDVENALREMVEQDLIYWYSVDGKQYIQIKNFDKHQTGLHKRTKSQYPAPEEGTPVLPTPPDSGTFREVPGNSGKAPEIPLEQNRTEQNRTEQNSTTTEQIDDVVDDDSNLDETQKALKEIEHHFIMRRGVGTMLSVKDMESMQDLLKEGFTVDEILAGIDHAFDNYKPKYKRDRINSFRYCEQVIRALRAEKQTGKKPDGFSNLPKAIRRQMEQEARGEILETEEDPKLKAEIMEELNRMRQRYEEKRAGGQ